MEPIVTVMLSELEPGQGFRYKSKEYVKPPREQRMLTTGNTIIFRLPYGVDVTEGAQVELILDKKEFRKIESDQEFYDKDGLRYMKTDDDFDYYDESHGERVNAFCFDNRNLFSFGLHDSVFVIVK